MNLQELIQTYGDDTIKGSIGAELDASLLGKELDFDMEVYFEKFSQNELIKPNVLNHFVQSINNQVPPAKDILIYLITKLAEKNYLVFESSINARRVLIEEHIKTGTQLPSLPKPDPNMHRGLLNAYHLFSQEGLNQPPTIPAHLSYKLQEETEDRINWEIPLALNTFQLTSQQRNKPFYPINLKTKMTESAAPLIKGVEDLNEYYPFKRADKSKVTTSFSGNSTVLTVSPTSDKPKLFYMRANAASIPSSAVLSSKIAQIISAKHFSSEQLLNNNIAISSSLPGYIAPLLNENYENVVTHYSAGGILEGVGLIDEVTNFLTEKDDNLDNFALSEKTISSDTYISKIDFSACALKVTTPSRMVKKTNYEQNILTKQIPEDTHITEKILYKKEKAYARLKLLLFSEELYENLATKAFIGDSSNQKNGVVAECLRRQNIALELLQENPELQSLIDETMFTRCGQEMESYIQDHFDEPERNMIIQSLHTRANEVREALGMGLSAAQKEAATPSQPVLSSLTAPAIVHAETQVRQQEVDTSKSLPISVQEKEQIIAAIDTCINNLKRIMDDTHSTKQGALIQLTEALGVVKNNINGGVSGIILTFNGAMEYAKWQTELTGNAGEEIKKHRHAIWDKLFHKEQTKTETRVNAILKNFETALDAIKPTATAHQPHTHAQDFRARVTGLRNSASQKEVQHSPSQAEEDTNRSNNAL